ncbi:hypothetical protein N1031_00880 [Herbiconiux moechotypicola]|uniref:Lytic transglycosylase domain-containing protein n=1 Tax=Herbiconiux moechotypicola TaxID=637393 RepID=A0ABN3D854_9MICO|nr:hypothetical protein [Herbiconiux moechotypicola]MCS5728306.1 hypothetical protein [Herbiconiux moechotypicola]
MGKATARSVTAIAAVLALTLGASLPAHAAPPPSLVRDEYPTWDEVNAAKSNAAAKQAEVDSINSLLAGLQDEAAARADEALQRGQEYLSAKTALDTATATADALAARAQAATEKATTADATLGRLAAQLYRSGGDSGLGLALDQSQADSLLYRLGTMAKLTEQTAGIRDQAVAARNTAAALDAQAEVARAERDALATSAQTALQSAEDARAAADAQVAETQSRSETLVAQLATLNDTTVELEKQYQAGAEYRAQQAAAQAAAEAASAAAAAANEVATGATTGAWVPDSSQVATPAEAQAYAASQMPAYGWGDSQFRCLVQLWIGESGWRANAYNPSSGAYGIPQSLPATKMASAGSDYITSAATQITWGLSYIVNRYDTPCGALSAWQARSPHWY